MDHEKNIQVAILTDRNATVAEVGLVVEPWSLTPTDVATGASKREPGDLYDPQIAVDLALGRALENLGRQLRKRAEKAVKAACPEPEPTGALVIHDELQTFLDAAEIKPEPWQKRILRNVRLWAA